MHLATFLFEQITYAVSSPWLIIPIIILGVMVVEEGTIATVGVLASSGQIPIAEGIIVLIVGVVLGDSFAYSVGRMANHYKFARRIVEYEHVARLRTIVKNNPIPTIFTTRFMPGFRFAFYAACGLFSLEYKRFLPVSIASAVIWVTLLFSVSFVFGFYTLKALGEWRWLILVVALLVFLFFGHRYWRKISYENKQ